jgi:hypothetical protein
MQAGNGDLPAAQVRRFQPVSGNNERATPSPHGSAGAEHEVPVPEMGKGVPGYFADIQSALQGKLVQGFHILQTHVKTEFAGIHPVVDQGIKEEGIVRAGGVPQ